MSYVTTARCSAVLALALGLPLLEVSTAHAVDLQATCQANKRRAAGKKASTKMNCVAKAVSKGDPVDSTCMAKAEVKFSTSFAKADAKGGCPVGQPEATVEATVDNCVTTFRNALGVSASQPPENDCSAAKVKATGNKTKAKVNCYARAIPRYAPVDSTCLAKAEVKFSTTFAKTDSKIGPCTGSISGVEGQVDSCVNNLNAALPAPTTTTTTTTTSTTICTDIAPGPYLSTIPALHNNQRNGAGQPSPAPNPPIPSVCWSNSVATTAQGWANGCTFAHNPNLHSLGLGENIYAACGDQRATAASGGVSSWASEESNYTYSPSGGGTCAGCNLYDSCGLGSNCTSTCCLHYSQVVWRTSVRVGCGIQLCNSTCPFNSGFPNWTILVCDYSPAGNHIGQSPY